MMGCYLKKAPAMYYYFGKDENHTCGECHNLVTFVYRGKTYRKCNVYGVTNSEASDWAKRWCACGMFNQEYNGCAVIKMNRLSAGDDDSAIDGQITLE